MSHPELIATIVAVGLAILVVAADIIVRLVIQPARKEQFAQELLDHLTGPDPDPQTAAANQPGPLPTGDLTECLLRHFERSLVSQQILTALAGENALSQQDLLAALNRALAEQGQAPLPFAVARRVATILSGAGLVGVHQGALRITEAGRSLNAILRDRRKTGRPL